MIKLRPVKSILFNLKKYKVNYVHGSLSHLTLAVKLGSL